jgi:alkylation response protein AidB-like acyl-CoA dehydrogenase
MNFGFDEDQKSLGDTVAKLLKDFPVLTGPDPVRPHNDDVWRALSELGLFALLVPERFDGVGLNMVDVALAVEALGAGLAPSSVTSTLAATDLLVRHGSEAQQRAFLPAIAAGAMKVAIATIEEGRSYAPDDVRTTYEAGLISGTKLLVGDAADADILLVLVQDAGKPAIMLVERTSPGVIVRPHEDIDASAGLCAVTFNAVAATDDMILGSASPGRAVARLFDTGATLNAGLMVGIAAQMLDASVDYARSRVQFGQAIGAFQSIKHRCADMAMAVEAGRSVAYYAAWALAEDAVDRTRAASMAKAYCGDVARQVCNDSIQVHGGMGFTWELGLHRFLRRAKILEHSFGDARFHHERVLAETLAGTHAASDQQLDAA